MAFRSAKRIRLVIAVAVCLVSLALLPRLATSQQQETTDQESVDFSSAEIEFFENKIRPLLVEHCLKCHGEDPDKVRGGLLLTSRAAILQGGDSGPAAISGNPSESLLLQSLHYEEFEMPPKGKLSDTEIAVFEKWIQIGLPDPRTNSVSLDPKEIDIEAGKQFWAFQPRSKSVPIEVENHTWSKSEIDRFIHCALVEKGIKPANDASRETLIRRAYIALIGLPPTPAQIDAFLDDRRSTDDAFAAVVDELLASPHFGERWGRHWLDVVRFAESSGGGRSLMFTDAWRFRDYVIEAYNKDKPFDLFIKEQIAGDLLPFESHEQKIEQIVATGMLALGPTNYEQQNKQLLTMEVIDEQVDTVGRAFMGLTLGCARCHDHKFDPIPMTDYYALAGIFKSTQSLVDGNVSKYVERSLETEEEIKRAAAYKKKVEAFSKKLVEAKKNLEKIQGVKLAKSNQKKSRDSSSLEGIVIDDRNAKLVGYWKESTIISYFVDGRYVHDDNRGKGKKKAIFDPKLESGGNYEVRLSYTHGGSRASNVPVTIDHQDGKEVILVNQSQPPPIDGLFLSLGTFRFEADNQSLVTIETKGTDGHVIVDAVQFIKQDEKTNAQVSRPDFKVDSDVGRNSVDTKKPILKAKLTDTTVVDSKKQERIRALEFEVRRIDNELRRLKKNAPRPTALAMSVVESEHPADGNLHIRGSFDNLGPVVKRGFVSVCCEGDSKPELTATESGRLQLAEWLADPGHPLTARVYVNRIWRHLFGTGLVATTDNFGTVGQRPSHPELLDYLAEEFVNDGWSTKQLIRKIMLSRVYQLSSSNNDFAKSLDPENRLLWRANRRRVDAEVLRDSILSVSGSLDLTAGGLTIRKITQYDQNYQFDTARRSVYVPAFRNSMLDVFEAFDFANPNLVIGHRNTSTLPTQALFFMNSELVVAESKNFAERILGHENQSEKEKVVLAYRMAIGRQPSEKEVEQAVAYMKNFKPTDAERSSEMSAWTSFCHALFASLDFRYVD